jgi:DNA replication and repair protein RecF
MERFLLAGEATPERVEEILKNNREIDKACGMTTFGNHRSDLEIWHKKNKRAARECSTGEQKILLIAVVLSFVHQMTRNMPGFLVFLLDDVIARLDFDHRMVLFDQIEALTAKEINEGNASVQAFFSGTDRVLFDQMRNAQFFEVGNSVITNQSH